MQPGPWNQEPRCPGLLNLGSWFRRPGCIKTGIKKLKFNATRPVEPRSKIQEYWASWFLVLGSTGRVALDFNFLMLVLMQTVRWKPYSYYSSHLRHRILHIMYVYDHETHRFVIFCVTWPLLQ